MTPPPMRRPPPARRRMPRTGTGSPARRLPGYPEAMETGAQTIARGRDLALSVETFRRIAIANAVMLVVIVATGATVRLTGSGLGCKPGPGCDQRHFQPRSFHSYVEFGNRVVAFLTILLTLVTYAG